MTDFNLWFSTGLQHIADWNGYDHILFLLALCGVYTLKEWKNILILITAFTIGHSITLALSVLNIIIIKSNVIEFLIPITILLTCVFNLYRLNKPRIVGLKFNYIITLLFGLIHGLGFSYLLKSLLGNDENILSPLFAFNIGLEAGQIIIVFISLFILLFLTALLRIKPRDKNFFISSAVFGIAFIMAIERLAVLINN